MPAPAPTWEVPASRVRCRVACLVSRAWLCDNTQVVKAAGAPDGRNAKVVAQLRRERQWRDWAWKHGALAKRLFNDVLLVDATYGGTGQNLLAASLARSLESQATSFGWPCRACLLVGGCFACAQAHNAHNRPGGPMPAPPGLQARACVVANACIEALAAV